MDQFGISVALVTPFDQAGGIDHASLGRHAAQVMHKGAQGVTLFGTTGEGASIAFGERAAALNAVLGAGVPAEALTLGICCTALADAVAEVKLGFDQGVTQFLVMPPFYFKNCSDDGLFDWHMQLVAATPDAARLILYHIPQVSDVPISVTLAGRLAAAAPGRFSAIKDSSGSWDNAAALLTERALPVLVGDERLLHRAVGLGAAGSICGMANLYPKRMVSLFESGVEDVALSAEVTEIVRVPFVPALKAILGARGEAGLARLRAPLTPLSKVQREALFTALGIEAQG